MEKQKTTNETPSPYREEIFDPFTDNNYYGTDNNDTYNNYYVPDD